LQLPNLKSLSFHDFINIEIKKIKDIPWTMVQILSLENNQLVNSFLENLIKLPSSHLRKINLNYNLITSGLKYLSRGHWPSLWKLTLYLNPFKE